MSTDVFGEPFDTVPAAFAGPRSGEASRSAAASRPGSGPRPGAGLRSGAGARAGAASREVLDPAGAARLLACAWQAGGGLGPFTRLALVSGARRGELLGIRWPDLAWPSATGEPGTLAIARQGGKTALARRQVALDPPTMDALALWRDKRREVAAGFGVDMNEAGYVFASEPTGKLPWLPDVVTRRVARAAAQTGVSVTVSGLRRYGMTRLAVLGVSADVIGYRLGLAVRTGAFPLFRSLETLLAADREAALLLGRELDAALGGAAAGAASDG